MISRTASFTLGSLAFLLIAAVRAAEPVADWMVDPSPYKANITEDKSRGELTLENGLAKRVLRLAPNAATVTLQNLTSGEHLLRAVAPEARVTIDGVDYPVGGLTGQSIQNYLKEDWIKDLRPLPGAYRFTGWEELPVVKRLEWKKRPEWLAKDHPWPPLGKHVVMHYDPPAAPAKTLGGPVVYEEKFDAFSQPKPGWTITASKAHARSSFSNEGKSGEIMALPDTSVFAERPWPEKAVSVELKLDAGDDTHSNAWGPGLALSAADGTTVHFIIRPNQQVFETLAGLGGKFDRAKPVSLRASLRDGTVVMEAAQDAGTFETIATLPFAKTPATLRIGKVGRGGNGGDYDGGDINANLTRCHMLEIAVRGAEPVVAAKPRADLPRVAVHYELYDGIPLFSKWLTVTHAGEKPVRLNSFVADELKLAEVESSVNNAPVSEKYNLWVETDMAFGDMVPEYANPCMKIVSDPDYPTQVHYERQTPCLLRCQPPLGPDQEVSKSKPFETFRVFELLLDSTERERRSLARRKMYRVIAPWTQENPLMFHKVQSDPKTIREAIDQAAEVGFEMVIMSFGSGFNFESRDPAYQDRYKELADYGRSKGVVIGGYSLLASRGAGDPKDNTTGSPARYGVMPCLGTQWGRDYLDTIVNFSRRSGLGIFENDGSYPGDICCATNHPFHRGKEDSQWVMWRAITDQYRALRAEGVFLNVPDWYFLTGANKCGMGYRETNWSLPRAEQEIIERQNMYDGTWTRTQSMGWMFVPLSQYHGGGAAATIEPLKEHLPHYEARFANLLGYGVQACYRGPRLFDSPETKALVTKWVSFYKQHRDVLDNGDIIHLRRPNGRDWDGILHANPTGREKGLACLYNPLDEEITREIRLPLHYTGLRKSARISIDGAEPQAVSLTPAHEAVLTVKIPGGGRTFLLFTE
ncbi:hypothetical protein OKA05_20580 [Luteolibacter arcticus]|uniref:Alpha-galactosidase n=1 Tax=Luteolibacter arcticus TaxID=1581411 RepID=A0ABT3GNB9_9BACT|nr:hypothetical protein [Luteolibacter arcticus]MCW1924971.1 hypothetical protein [Luteolibacter arcticus]